LLEGINVWFGGALQYDAVSLEDLYVANQGGGSETDTFTRRAEVTVRATLFDLGEFKLQYDVDGDFWRDLYFRHADEEREYTLTIGNQTEPMSQENILGNKFNAAMEIAAPTSIFAPNRGMGVKLNKWWGTGQAPSLLSLSDDPDEAVTASIGIFREDIEDTSDTDWSVTGRTSAGRKYGDWGIHVGMSGSYRDGDFDRINPRPELQGTDRIPLANFDADTLKIVSLETLAARGSWHGTAELYYADFDGGEVDATGYGGFVEVGYYLTGQSRSYRPRWGLWAPLKVGARNIFEVFGRFSYTRGDADDDPSNDLRIVTLGGSWYRHKIRVSANLLYSKTDRPVAGQDDGFGAGLRFQYLF
jgi:phosphate-selective porin OprO/OprP